MEEDVDWQDKLFEELSTFVKNGKAPKWAMKNGRCALTVVSPSIETSMELLRCPRAFARALSSPVAVVHLPSAGSDVLQAHVQKLRQASKAYSDLEMSVPAMGTMNLAWPKSAEAAGGAGKYMADIQLADEPDHRAWSRELLKLLDLPPFINGCLNGGLLSALSDEGARIWPVTAGVYDVTGYWLAPSKTDRVAVTGWHTEAADLRAINVRVRSTSSIEDERSDRHPIWVFIDKSDNNFQRFSEAHLAATGQTARHDETSQSQQLPLSVYVTAGVTFTVCQQRLGDMIVTGPALHHCVMTPPGVMKIAVNFLTIRSLRNLRMWAARWECDVTLTQAAKVMTIAHTCNVAALVLTHAFL